MKVFLFTFFKSLLGYWAAKLLSPESVTELLITIADAHAKNTKTDTDDRLIKLLSRFRRSLSDSGPNSSPNTTCLLLSVEKVISTHPSDNVSLYVGH